jgi:Ni,Fe-hydrogenase maturation factor
MRTLILGMGNPILSDDAIGIRLARELRAQLKTATPSTPVSTSTTPASTDIIDDWEVSTSSTW